MDGENNGKPNKNGMIWEYPYFWKYPDVLLDVLQKLQNEGRIPNAVFCAFATKKCQN